MNIANQQTSEPDDDPIDVFLDAHDSAPVAPPLSVRPPDDHSPEQTENPEPEARPGIAAITLYKPIMINGSSVRRLILDFNCVDTVAMEEIERQMTAQGVAAFKNPAYSGTYCLRIAARAAGLNPNDLGKLNCKDYQKLVSATQDFLMGYRDKPGYHRIVLP